MYYEIKSSFLGQGEGQFTTEAGAIKYFNAHIYPKQLITNIKHQTFPKSNYTVDQLRKGVGFYKLETVK